MQAWIRYIGLGCLGAIALACGSKGDGDPATGGAGGGAATAGTSGGGTGGGTGGGDTGGAGGTAGTGGGTAGTGGSSGGTCRTAPTGTETTMFNFDAAQTVCATGCTNLNDVWKVEYTSADTVNGREPIPVESIVASWSETEGDPDPGAMQVEIPYATAGQYVGVGINFATAQDLTDKVITARVKVTGLGDPMELMTTPGGAKVYAKSGTGYVYAAGTFTNVGDAPHPLDTWFTVPFDLRPTASSMTGCFSYVDETNAAGSFDPSQVLEIGIQFDTGGTQATVLPATVYVDSVAF